MFNLFFLHFLIQSLKQSIFSSSTRFSYWQTGGLKDAALWLSVADSSSLLVRVSCLNSNIRGGGAWRSLHHLRHDGMKPRTGEKSYQTRIWSVETQESLHPDKVRNEQEVVPAAVFHLTDPSTTEPGGQSVLKASPDGDDTRPRTKTGN